MADHPRYPGSDRLVLIGDTAHDALADPRTGTVASIYGDVIVSLRWYSGKFIQDVIQDVPIERLRIGPAPEPIELTIKPTRDELHAWVHDHDKFGPQVYGRAARDAIVAGIPADLLAELRAEIEAERQS